MHLIINGWFVGQPTTGSGQYIHHLLTHMPPQGPQHRFTLLVPQPGPGAIQDWSQEWPGVEVLALPLPRLPGPLAKLWWEQVTVPAQARRLGGDVLWVPYWAGPLWQPLPVVVTVHDLIPRLLPEYRGGLANRLYTALVSWTARRAAAILTVSQASARDIVAHLGVPEERVFPVHHGPNLAGASPPSAEELARVRARYRLPARFFLYLGGFDVRKNVGTVLRAYRRFLEKGGDPEVKLVVAGKLPERETPFFPDPQRLANELGIRERVHFVGWVAEGDKPALYALATAFLFPSRYEGFGMMVLEAMGAGCPVITSEE